MTPTTFLYAFIVSMVSFMFLQPIFSPADASAAGCSQKIEGYECVGLAELKSTLHYFYNRLNSTLSIVFVAAPPTPKGWIGWGINPTGQGMVGAQAIVAFRNDDLMTTVTLDIKSLDLIVPGPLLFETWGLKAEENGSFMKIYASLKVPNNTQTLNHIWQVGDTVVDGKIFKHDRKSENLHAKGRLYLNGATDYRGLKNVYEILNILAYGVLLHIGVMILRFRKKLEKRFRRRFPSLGQVSLYLHVSCQSLAFLIGVAGAAVGLSLSSILTEIHFSVYRKLGFALLFIAFVQCTALLCRPPENHKYISFWRLYHFGLGYICLAMGTGYSYMTLEIFNADYCWTIAYSTWVSIWGVIFVLLEIVPWFI